MDHVRANVDSMKAKKELKNNSKQNWNHDECLYELWNPSTFDCECNKASKID